MLEQYPSTALPRSMMDPMVPSRVTAPTTLAVPTRDGDHQMLLCWCRRCCLRKVLTNAWNGDVRILLPSCFTSSQSWAILSKAPNEWLPVWARDLSSACLVPSRVTAPTISNDPVLDIRTLYLRLYNDTGRSLAWTMCLARIHC